MLRTVQKEKERIDYMMNAYLKQLDSLPKGSVIPKTVGKNVYYYLKYRNGKKVYTDYLGKDSEKVQTIRKKIEKRRHIEVMLAGLQAELSLANKILEGKR